MTHNLIPVKKWVVADDSPCREEKFREAAEHIVLIAALLGLLKDGGIRRDGEDGEDAFELSFAGEILRELGGETPPIPPGYTYNEITFRLDADPEYIKDDSFLTELAARTGGDDTPVVVGWAPRSGSHPQITRRNATAHSRIQASLGYGRLWAALLRCGEDKTFGEWGPEETRAYKNIAKKIAWMRGCRGRDAGGLRFFWRSSRRRFDIDSYGVRGHRHLSVYSVLYTMRSVGTLIRQENHASPTSPRNGKANMRRGRNSL
ncbi:hypothetical protein B0H17DRAFT_1142540 [Mycena rosella]|uniref:Uncharacterized protein n=1 Tax=Mycena rosella TaxID=1033263 RepID=A0AAD7G8X7_MYCRO|nr:hypothetical protein B0H17DRAFT_1142540 [Mycena rosella]